MKPVDWDARYAGDEYFYGTTPNAFLAAQARQIPAGPVLCLAEGEGRNAVWLAAQGFTVTAVDSSAVGMAKAQRLATARGQTIATEVADLADYEIRPGTWSGVVAIFMHLPVALRQRVLARVALGLRPGGVFLLEAYTPRQIAFGTGGPKDPNLLVTLSALRHELPSLKEEWGAEVERDVQEGGGHTGLSAVVQFLARRVRIGNGI